MITKKAIIYVDMDATLNYHKKELIARIPKEQRDEVKISNFRDTTYFQNFIKTSDKEQVLYEIYNQKDFWLSLEPAKDAFETLQYIKNRFSDQVELRVATALPWVSTVPDKIKNDKIKLLKYHNIVKRAKKQWLKKHFPKVFSRVVFIHDKSTLDGFCLIDDLQHSLKDFPLKGFSTQLWIQMGLERNSAKEDHPDLYVRNWSDLRNNVSEFFTFNSLSIYLKKYQQLYDYVTGEGKAFYNQKEVKKALKTLKIGTGKPKRLW